MPLPQSVAPLLVEGKNDQHVIWALCKDHNVSETFTVETPPESDGGINKLLDSIPVRLKTSRLRALGIVLDADQDIQARWNAICHRLTQAGYDDLPKTPHPTGSIIRPPDKPIIGIWIMPDNQVTGFLENFIAHLIPENDLLHSKAQMILQDIEQSNLQRYVTVHRPKAFIHTWHAWQKVPGQPMGQAITAKVLYSNSLLAKTFVAWLNELFN